MWFINALQGWMLLLGMLIFAYWYVREKFSFWAKRGVAFRSPHWLFGNFGDWLTGKTHMSELMVTIYKEFRSERFCGIWRFFSPTLFIIDPELVRQILVKDQAIWSKRGLPFNPDVDPLSENLVNLDGHKWKTVRTQITPVFTPGKLKQMYQLMLECGKEFEKYLDKVAVTSEFVEVNEMCAKFTTDVNGLCALGVQMNSFSDDNSVYRTLRKQTFEPTLQQKICMKLLFSSPRLFKLLNLTVQTQEVTDFFFNIMKQNFEYRDKQNVQRNDFIDLLRSLRNTGEPLGQDKVEFDDKLLAAQAFDFFVTGFEFTSGAISFCLYELAVNDDIQDRLREEVHKAKAAGNGEITWDGLHNMTYLDMVVQETVRKYPGTTLAWRMSIKPYRIPNTEVELPSGSTCIIPIYAIHHDPEYYPDPERFNPERFTHEAKNQRTAFTYLPFGAGPRNCIALNSADNRKLSSIIIINDDENQSASSSMMCFDGLRFAEYQIKVALVKVIDKFKVSLRQESRDPLDLDRKSKTLIPKDGIWLRISKNLSN